MGAIAQTPLLATSNVVWRALPGSQEAFLSSPVYETLYSGERGPGKTDALLMDFAQECGKGYDHHWRGVIFRRTYPELEDIISKAQAWFAQFAPEAKWNGQKSWFRWPTGETLLFRNFEKASNYWKYHGHAYPFIGWEEITNWPDDTCYKSMFSCSRSTRADMPRKYRATTNPYGVGHQWVKMRWRLEGCPKTHQIVTPVITDAVDDDGYPEPQRVAIFGKLKENTILLDADPEYPSRIRASASNPAMADAWMSGSWDIIAGGMFEHCWDRDVHILDPFEIPNTWRIDRSYDYGSSAPFAVIWTAQSDGSDFKDNAGRWRSSVRGDLFIVREWYGWNGKPNQGLYLTMNETASGIIEREMKWGWRTLNELTSTEYEWHARVSAGPADTSIFDEEDGTSLAKSMAKPIRMQDGKRAPGLHWNRADKRPGSRKLGWQKMIEYFQNAKRPEVGVRELPGLFVIGRDCPQWVRTVPSLPRDEKDMDDVDTEAEDHMGDATRYRVVASAGLFSSGSNVGMQ